MLRGSEPGASSSRPLGTQRCHGAPSRPPDRGHSRGDPTLAGSSNRKSSRQAGISLQKGGQDSSLGENEKRGRGWPEVGPRSGDSKGRGQTQGRTADARRVSRPGSCGESVTTKASTGPTPPQSLRSRSLPERCRGSTQSVPPPSPGPHRPADTEPGRHCAPQRAPPRNGWAVTGCGRSREPPLPLPGRPVMADRKELAEPSWAGWVAVGACPSGATEGLAPTGSHSRMRGCGSQAAPLAHGHTCAHTNPFNGQEAQGHGGQATPLAGRPVTSTGHPAPCRLQAPLFVRTGARADCRLSGA